MFSPRGGRRHIMSQVASVPPNGFSGLSHLISSFSMNASFHPARLNFALSDPLREACDFIAEWYKETGCYRPECAPFAGQRPLGSGRKNTKALWVVRPPIAPASAC